MSGTVGNEEGLRAALTRLIREADNDRTLRYQSVELNDAFRLAKEALASPDTAPPEEWRQPMTGGIDGEPDYDHPDNFPDLAADIRQASMGGPDFTVASWPPDTAPPEEAYCCPCCDAPPGHKPCPARLAPLAAPPADEPYNPMGLSPTLLREARTSVGLASQSVSESATASEKTTRLDASPLAKPHGPFRP